MRLSLLPAPIPTRITLSPEEVARYTDAMEMLRNNPAAMEDLLQAGRRELQQARRAMIHVMDDTEAR